MTQRAGRPLRFLMGTLGGWVVLRIVTVWPTLTTPGDVARLFVPPVGATALKKIPAEEASRAAAVARPKARPESGAVAAHHPVVDALPSEEPPSPTRLISFERQAQAGDAGSIPPPLRPTPAHGRDRLTASIWGIARRGTGAGLPGGQLGGSQAGVRVAYALDEARRLAITGRVSAPLAGLGSEAALGIEYRVPGMPVRLLVERRLALDRGRAGTAAYLVAGLAPTRLAGGFRLEAYGQTGIVVRQRALGFADGAARVARPLGQGLDLGFGAWGGVQPGVARVDVGPTLGAAVPVGGRAVRVTLDWRQRVAGAARPGSGPALTIGGDF